MYRRKITSGKYHPKIGLMYRDCEVASNNPTIYQKCLSRRIAASSLS